MLHKTAKNVFPFSNDMQFSSCFTPDIGLLLYYMDCFVYNLINITTVCICLTFQIKVIYVIK